MTAFGGQRTLRSTLLGGLCVALLCAVATAETATPSAPAPEAWIVSTRSVSANCPVGIQPDRFTYRHSLDGCSPWHSVEPAEFFTEMPVDEPIIVFVHGNRTGACDVVNLGRPAFSRLQRDAPDRSFRFVHWSWPADRVGRRPRRDVQIKAARSDTQAHYLAAWLRRLPDETPVTLIGYSFGARVIAGALHLNQGGSLNGWSTEEPAAETARRPCRVMLVAAALDAEWLLPGRRNGQAFGGVEQMLITRNTCDPVLRLYPRMDRCDDSEAMGFAGPAGSWKLAEVGFQFETVPVECQVGRDHAWATYISSHAVGSRLAWYSFLLDEHPAAVTATP